MALGLLSLLFVLMAFLGIAGTASLLLVKSKKINDVILILMTVYSLVIAYLGASSQPSNFVTQQIVCWVIGVIAIIGTALRFITKKQLLLSKLLVILSVLGGLYCLFF